MRASARDVPRLQPYYRQSACSSSWSATSKMLRIAPQHATGAATCRRAAAPARAPLLSLQPLKLLWGESVRHPHIPRMQWSMATLLTRLRSLIWPSDPKRYCLSHKLVPEPCAVGLDEPRRRMWKMDRQNIFAGPGDLGEKLPPRPRGLRRIPVEDRRPIGLATLQGVVHEVADHDRVLSARADIDAAMVGRMARRRHEPKRIVELIAVVDEQRLASFDGNCSETHCRRRQREFRRAWSIPPRRHIRLCGKYIWLSEMSAPSVRRAAPCSSRNGRYADACRTHNRCLGSAGPRPQNRRARAVSESPSAADSLCFRRCRYR